MDDVFYAVLRGCVMARELEANLETIAQQPHVMRASCEEIATNFAAAVQRLSAFDQPGEAPPMGLSIGGMTTAPEAAVATQSIGVGSTGFFPISGQVKASERGGGEVREDEGCGSRQATWPPVQRASRIRKNGGMRIIQVQAPRTPGNLDIPPDDGYTWRKYGQKTIFGARFPRSYYRCTHKNFYGCEAKKQVQRLDEDPFVYEIAYCGDHTCRTTTVPLPLPPIPPMIPQMETSLPPTSTLSHSLPTTTSIQTRLRNPRETETAGGSGVAAGSSPQGGEGGRDVDNSVGVSSVDSIFFSMQNK